jgi:hypothetical protein
MALAFTEQRSNNTKKRGIGVASGAVTRNASASGAGVVTVLQVPPPAALVEEPGATCMPIGMGMGGQSGAVGKATRAHRRRTKILSVVPFG